ncbi:ATP-binding protein [Frankia sp. AgB1.9]|uniref:ATP-binding protein n=1 Tax=unclassified Frankia TaxID=2632575 RepID=UPI0019336C7F|nr:MULTISPECIES: ATP-binding protein [unclassified Frankia]MBL7493693.1 ATP-binding protein [Frankia sp. AgW1.1]MBL7553022.1 ATP-binding protein [Frankia sp. AgB1.9]MBL7621586.1 ATP-binding protein [Frankia sp. AgB1.8]
MKIAFVGKGGSGKTTLSSLFIRHLAAAGRPVLAMDADINQHLAVALGMDEREAAAIPTLGDHLPEIKDYLRGDNPRIPSGAVMVKTTPPGRGSRRLPVTGPDPLLDRLSVRMLGARLLATGAFTEEDLGVACYHSKVGAVELLLNHLLDGPGEYVVVDMTAGADAFASGLFTRFDRTFLVVEPTRKAVAVYRQYRDYAATYDIPLSVIGNKITGSEDVAYLRDQIGDDLLVCLGHSPAVRAMEQGRPLSIDDLEASTRTALDTIHHTVDATPRDWDRLTRQMVDFHLKNARAWANEATGTDLAAQVDPDFVLGPDLLASR